MEAMLLVTLVALLSCALALAVVVIWSIKRHRDPRLRIESDAPLAELLHSLSGLTHGVALKGNAVEILENGAYCDVLLAEIGQATRSVHFETFLWKDGALGRRLVDALTERSRAGVTVRVLVDATGGKEMGAAAVRRLEEAGCKFDTYHPRRLRTIGVLNERDHRKIVVLDGRTALVGGHCIVDSWLGCAQDGEHFRDLSVRLRGPVVHAIQSAFSENWVEETGELFVGEDVFPELAPAGEVEIHVARVKPEGSAPAVKILHHLAICCARERIWIQNPYFLPEPAAIEALGRAVARGVDVRVMVPSAGASDMPIVQHAAHRNFEWLLILGVRLFEYRKTLLHQKVMTIDGVWCAIGSSNFDDRSFEINDEITLGIMDAPLARQLEAIFERDGKACVELGLEAWRRRGLGHRLKDNLLYLFNELM
jgi:cardiolipin synthase A/B